MPELTRIKDAITVEILILEGKPRQRIMQATTQPMHYTRNIPEFMTDAEAHFAFDDSIKIDMLCLIHEQELDLFYQVWPILQELKGYAHSKQNVTAVDKLAALLDALGHKLKGTK
jgi:hypothetical protein